MRTECSVRRIFRWFEVFRIFELDSGLLVSLYLCMAFRYVSILFIKDIFPPHAGASVATPYF